MERSETDARRAGTAATSAPNSALLRAAYTECQVTARRAARNFYYSFLVLPRRERLAMCALYTFMRLTDDLGDSEAPVAARRDALLEWRRKLDHVLAGGRPDANWWLALADTVQRYSVPPQTLHAVVDGVTSDLDTCRYETFAELYQYCYQVASVVGLACVRVWGTEDAQTDQLAEWCGVAFQLTNILRDLREDHERGRIYLPGEDLKRFGVTEEELGQSTASVAFLELMDFEIARARDYYQRCRPLFERLPPPGRAVLRVMVDVYGGLLEKIARRPDQVLRRRVSLSGVHKLALVARALPTRLFGGWGSARTPSSESRVSPVPGDQGANVS